VEVRINGPRLRVQGQDFDRSKTKSSELNPIGIWGSRLHPSRVQGSGFRIYTQEFEIRVQNFTPKGFKDQG
jgi:hypothetical protein